MADFPRIKWLNVDGQQVPFTEPQHFTGNGDETVRTGKDNPLPVANYTKKGNIWLPVSEENPLPTQVTGSIAELFKIENYRLNSGQSKWFDNFELTKPHYTIYIYFINENGNDLIEDLEIREQRLLAGLDDIFVIESASKVVVESEFVSTSSGKALISSKKYTTKSPLGRVYINNTSDHDVDFSIQVIGFDA